MTAVFLLLFVSETTVKFNQNAICSPQTILYIVLLVTYRPLRPWLKQTVWTLAYIAGIDRHRLSLKE